jgi:hypothetical protein
MTRSAKRSTARSCPSWPGSPLRAGSGALFVPYAATRDPAQALLLCKLQGLLRDKLAVLDPARRDVIYQTTRPRSDAPS